MTGGGGGGGASIQCDLLDAGCDCLRVATLGFRGALGAGDVFADWIAQSAQHGVADLGASVLTGALLEPYHVIVVQDVRLGTPAGVGSGIGRHYSWEERDALAGWVKRGGGLLTLSGFGDASSDVENVNMLLAPLGMSYASTPILPGGAWVTHWAAHPLGSGMGTVWFMGGHAVSGSTHIASQPQLGAYDVARANSQGEGRVLAWGDESITYGDSFHSADGTRFWLNILSWLTPPTQCEVVVPP